MIDVTLDPELWKDIDPGTEALADAWHVKEGDHVQAGQPLVTVVLVKTTQEVVAPRAGTIARILVAAEDTFKRGQVLTQLEEDA
jgi:pyruvate/2-oxoglutarate dehydrogenase complex dihydrolipoamide acyltransferase (E2) component|nr:lipoyl domain-containing protein [Thiomonas sp.]